MWTSEGRSCGWFVVTDCDPLVTTSNAPMTKTATEAAITKRRTLDGSCFRLNAVNATSANETP